MRLVCAHAGTLFGLTLFSPNFQGEQSDYAQLLNLVALVIVMNS